MPLSDYVRRQVRVTPLPATHPMGGVIPHIPPRNLRPGRHVMCRPGLLLAGRTIVKDRYVPISRALGLISNTVLWLAGIALIAMTIIAVAGLSLGREIFPASGVKGGKDASAGRAYGRLQVIDVSDMDEPRSVAWYEPEFGGVHNIWVAGDTLYMGAYNGGFRAFDVSGELRGDLRAQNREIVHVNTADMNGKNQNTAMTWGVVVKDGLAYVNDMYNGLWIVKIEPKAQPLTP